MVKDVSHMCWAGSSEAGGSSPRPHGAAVSPDCARESAAGVGGVSAQVPG